MKSTHPRSNIILPRHFLSGYPFIILSVVLLLAGSFSPCEVTAGTEKIALDGYDTVAYFTIKKATKGTQKFSHKWNGRVWYFSTAAHRDLFIASPEKYAPQFNGFCANGLSDGHAVDANPTNWRIIDDKLYLFFSEHGRNQWSGDVKPLLESAQETYRSH